MNAMNAGAACFRNNISVYNMNLFMLNDSDMWDGGEVFQRSTYFKQIWELEQNYRLVPMVWSELKAKVGFSINFDHVFWLNKHPVIGYKGFPTIFSKLKKKKLGQISYNLWQLIRSRARLKIEIIFVNGQPMNFHEEYMIKFKTNENRNENEFHNFPIKNAESNGKRWLYCVCKSDVMSDGFSRVMNECVGKICIFRCARMNFYNVIHTNKS